jgi:steroid delta-isomerase-like uncharacterized protein
MAEAPAVAQNRQIAQRFIDEVVNGRNLQTAAQIIAPNARGRVSGDPQERVGVAGLQKGLNFYSSTCPDFKVQVHDMVADGNSVAFRWSGTGTHTGHFEKVRATGKKIELSGLAMCRVEGGKIVEGYWYGDQVSVMHQLGITDGLAFLGVEDHVHHG